MSTPLELPASDLRTCRVCSRVRPLSDFNQRRDGTRWKQCAPCSMSRVDAQRDSRRARFKPSRQQMAARLPCGVCLCLHGFDAHGKASCLFCDCNGWHEAGT